jgi:hypothetical protein
MAGVTKSTTLTLHGLQPWRNTWHARRRQDWRRRQTNSLPADRILVHRQPRRSLPRRPRQLRYPNMSPSARRSAARAIISWIMRSVACGKDAPLATASVPAPYVQLRPPNGSPTYKPELTIATDDCVGSDAGAKQCANVTFWLQRAVLLRL